MFNLFISRLIEILRYFSGVVMGVYSRFWEKDDLQATVAPAFPFYLAFFPCIGYI